MTDSDMTTREKTGLIILDFRRYKMIEVEEIEVGEYVRTYNGAIFKVVGGNADDYLIDIDYVDLGKTENEDYYWLNHNDNGRIIRRITKSHSHNIIDLIEVGDYVNGNKILKIFEISKVRESKELFCMGEGGFEGEISYFNEDIQTIVTHEQFKSMEYEVREDDQKNERILDI